jgi:hypothetical protein
MVKRRRVEEERSERRETRIMPAFAVGFLPKSAKRFSQGAGGRFPTDRGPHTQRSVASGDA